MDNLQELLDKGADATERMHGQCVKVAKHYCKVGNFPASAKAWRLAAVYATAMAEGREVTIGGISARAGDK